MILGPSQVLEVTPTSTAVNALQVPGILHGWAWYNPSETVDAYFELRDGPLGALIVPITLCPGETARDWLAGAAIEMQTGAALVNVVGTVMGSLWFRTFPHNKVPAPLDVVELADRLIDGMFGG